MSLAKIVRNTALILALSGPSALLAQDNTPKQDPPGLNPPAEQDAKPAKFTDYKNIQDSVICIRNTVFRERPLYMKDGNLVREYAQERAFGTGFIFTEKDGYCYIVTNHHVANDDLVNWQGQKKVIEINEIVDKMDDRFTKDDVKLEFMGSDPVKDIALLRVKKDAIEQVNKDFKKSMAVYKGPIGDSSTLKSEDEIVVEGFPLALMKATTKGIVSNKDFLDEHSDYGWKHHDVVIDTAINPGNSGSPAFHKLPDGSYEWVGQVHAGWRAEGLKLFIQINEFKEYLTALKIAVTVEPKLETSQKDLESIMQYVAAAPETERLFHAFGSTDRLSQKLGNQGAEITHTVYTGNFPLDQRTTLEFYDTSTKPFVRGAPAPAGGLGTLDKVVITGGAYGRKELDVSTLPADLKAMAQQVYTVLNKIAVRSIEYKAYTVKGELAPSEQAIADGLLKGIERLQRENGKVYEIFQQNLQVYLEQDRLNK